MKKLLYMSLFVILFLSGCEKNPSVTAPESLFQMSGTATAAGVKPGDGPKEFKAAYRNYTIQVAYNEMESTYMVMSIDRIPYEDPISTIIANLFINGEPVSEEKLCEENDTEPENLHALLSSAAFLRRNEVIYRYLIFDWEGGVITDIDSDELNYNETFEVPYVEM